MTLHVQTRFFFFFFFFACGSSAPVRIECEGGEVAWLMGTLVAQSVQDTDITPLPQELWLYLSHFSRLS